MIQKLPKIKNFPVNLNSVSKIIRALEGYCPPILEPANIVQEKSSIFPLTVKTGKQHTYTVEFALPAYDEKKFNLIHELQKFNIPVVELLDYVYVNLYMEGKLWKEYTSLIED